MYAPPLCIPKAKQQAIRPLFTEMVAQLRRDYMAMAGMIFGEVPEWETITQTIRLFESREPLKIRRTGEGWCPVD